MILSKTSEYAVRILVYMAANNEEKYSAKFLYEQLNIPYKYLTKLMTDLAKRGCIESIQGRNGGFRIAKDLKDITLASVVEAVEGVSNLNGCILGFDECSDENPCAMHAFWEKNKANILHIFESTSLQDLANADIARF
jgi:Rrf2 family protein